MDVQIYQQIFFANYNIKKLYQNQKKENFIGIFYYLQSLLVCMGNISKILQHSDDFREHLGINIKEIPIIMDRKLRNINEHIDESLKKEKNLNAHYSDMATGTNDLESKKDYLETRRFFNTKTGKIQYVDTDGSIYEIMINEIEKELLYLHTLEPINYVFERYRGYDVIY